MFSVTITRKTRNLEKLVEKMERLSKESVETGVFIQQGEHPKAEMSFVDLARMHEEGDGNFPPRTVRPLILNEMKEQRFMNRLTKHLNSYLLGDNSINYALGYIGQDMAKMGRDFFGEVSNPWMTSNASETIMDKGGRNTPLVDEGYLRDAWAYKTSISDYIVESM